MHRIHANLQHRPSFPRNVDPWIVRRTGDDRRQRLNLRQRRPKRRGRHATLANLPECSHRQRLPLAKFAANSVALSFNHVRFQVSTMRRQRTQRPTERHRRRLRNQIFLSGRLQQFRGGGGPSGGVVLADQLPAGPPDHFAQVLQSLPGVHRQQVQLYVPALQQRNQRRHIADVGVGIAQQQKIAGKGRFMPATASSIAGRRFVGPPGDTPAGGSPTVGVSLADRPADHQVTSSAKLPT